MKKGPQNPTPQFLRSRAAGKAKRCWVKAGSWQCTFRVIGGESSTHVLRPPAVVLRDCGRRTIEVTDTRPSGGVEGPDCFGPRATTTEARGTGADNDAVPTYHRRLLQRCTKVTRDGDDGNRRTQVGWVMDDYNIILLDDPVHFVANWKYQRCMNNMFFL